MFSEYLYQADHLAKLPRGNKFNSRLIPSAADIYLFFSFIVAGEEINQADCGVCDVSLKKGTDLTSRRVTGLVIAHKRECCYPEYHHGSDTVVSSHRDDSTV